MEVAKNDLFELMMLFNKDRFLKGFAGNRRREAAFDHIKQNMYNLGNVARNIYLLSRNARKYKNS